MEPRAVTSQVAAGRLQPWRKVPLLILASCIWLSHCVTALRDGPLHTAADVGAEEEKFIGWRGDTYKPKPKSEAFQPELIQLLSWKPRAFVYRNFISDSEAQHIANLAAITMKRSTVVGANGSSVVDNYRTSYGTFISRRHDPIVTAVQERAALWTKIPAWHQEDMQVLRYAPQQYYHRHMDSLEDDSPRLATMLVYLSDPEEGGETAFPVSEWSSDALRKQLEPFSECVKGNVAFKPRRGDALLFWSVNLDGKTQDPHSEHEGCPVMKGVKWTATIWTHTVPYRYDDWKAALERTTPEELDDPGICKDTNERCAEWARAGECTKNPGYMAGACRAACKTCEVCKKGDRACYNRNRAKAGYLVYTPDEIQISHRGPGQSADGTLRF